MSSDDRRPLLIVAVILGAAALSYAQASPTTTLDRFDQELRATYRQAAPSVLKLSVLGPDGRTVVRTASGFVIEGTDCIVTTEGLLSGASYAIAHRNGGEIRVPLLGSDSLLNIAALALPSGDEAEPPPGLRPGRSDTATPGAFVLAVGCTFDFGPEPALGLVSGREFGRFRMGGWPTWHLRTSVPLSPEQVGGPLLSCRGEAIGMTVGCREGQSQAYALPIETVLRVVGLIRERGGAVQHGWIGVRVEDIESGGGRSAGVSVGDIRLRSPADGTGLQRGDRILRIGDHPVLSVPDVFEAMLGMQPGRRVDIEVARQDSTHTFSVEIGERPLARILPPVPFPLDMLPLTEGGRPGDQVPQTIRPQRPRTPSVSE